MGISATLDPWVAYQWTEAVDMWGTAVENRLNERRMERFEPPKEPMRPVPVHDLNSALGIDESGKEIDLQAQQEEMIRARFKQREVNHDRTDTQNGMAETDGSP